MWFSKLKFILAHDLLYNTTLDKSFGKNTYQNQDVNCNKESPEYKQLLFEIKIKEKKFLRYTPGDYDRQALA